MLSAVARIDPLMLLSGDLSHFSITSARLRLQARTAADTDETFAEVNDRIATYMSWNPPSSKQEYIEISQSQIANMKAGRDLQLVIRRALTSEFIGCAGLHSAEAALLETGVWIKESAQGHGYGREAVVAVMKWASETFRPSGFLWPVVDENTPSRRLAEALRGEIIATQQRQKEGDRRRTLLLFRIPVPDVMT
jgi:RimJ/RimL family protein N-acetyltransferase